MESELAAVQDGWTPERIELVKRTVCPKGISSDEFLLFMEQCKRSGLDPLIKEAFCVPRRVNLGTRDKPQWGTKHEFQPSEAGMLSRAERFADYRGIRSGCVYEGDSIKIHQGTSEVLHDFDPTTRKGHSILGAWAVVLREGRSYPVAWVDFMAYVQDTPLWKKIPATMIEKCARVAALRKAYPAAFGGLYIKEELPEEDREAPSRVEEVREAMAAKGLIQPAELPALPAPSIQFGPMKGRPISSLSMLELSNALDDGRQKLDEAPKDANWRGRLDTNLRELEAEMERRQGEAAGPVQAAMPFENEGAGA